MTTEHGIDPKLKESINEEGWENYARVVVGKRQEIDRAKELVDIEGKVENVDTYIRLHKKIIVGKEQLKKEFDTYFRGDAGGKNQEALQPGLAEYNLDTLTFIDREGNLAVVEVIDPEKISEVKKLMEQGGNFRKIIQDQLALLSFRFEVGEDIRRFWGNTRLNEKYTQQDAAKKTKREQFDF